MTSATRFGGITRSVAGSQGIVCPTNV
eukprot:COSAG06_NODE_62321_length_265_cov_0.777108_1_plen_26_part_01